MNLIKKKLYPKIWNKDDTINPDVRKKLIEIAKDFIEYTKVKNLKLHDIIFTGSLANYNYHSKSDVDLHLIFNLSNFERHRKFINEYLQTKRTVWNNDHDITIRGFNVEIYPEDEVEQHSSSGKFSLIQNEWIVKPKIQDASVVDSEEVKKKYQDMVDQVLYFEDEASKKDVNFKVLIKNIEKFLINLRDSRKSSLKVNGELSSLNLAFKKFRNNGYIQKIHDLKDTIYDTHMSLKEMPTNNKMLPLVTRNFTNK